MWSKALERENTVSGGDLGQSPSWRPIPAGNCPRQKESPGQDLWHAGPGRRWPSRLGPATYVLVQFLVQRRLVMVTPLHLQPLDQRLDGQTLKRQSRAVSGGASPAPTPPSKGSLPQPGQHLSWAFATLLSPLLSACLGEPAKPSAPVHRQAGLLGQDAAGERRCCPRGLGTRRYVPAAYQGLAASRTLLSSRIGSGAVQGTRGAGRGELVRVAAQGGVKIGTSVRADELSSFGSCLLQAKLTDAWFLGQRRSPC